MAEISLSVYQNRLDDLLAKGQFNEVIAHSRHILVEYPKNLKAYSQMGQALFAASRWDESAELFRRLLGALPGDFAAHYHLGQIYQHLEQIDDAIWHTERAYDQQPNNSAVIDQLRSLYREHRGKDVQRLQLTAGAVAQQHIRNSLYQEAISVLNKALARYPNRIDLKVLLIRALWQVGKHLDAAENAIVVLEKLPYAMIPNRILTELWLMEQRPSDAQRYLSRIEDLDPHLAYKLATGEDALESLITIEELDYEAISRHELATSNPDWLTTLGEVEADVEDDLDFDDLDMPDDVLQTVDEQVEKSRKVTDDLENLLSDEWQERIDEFDGDQVDDDDLDDLFGEMDDDLFAELDDTDDDLGTLDDLDDLFEDVDDSLDTDLDDLFADLDDNPEDLEDLVADSNVVTSEDLDDLFGDTEDNIDPVTDKSLPSTDELNLPDGMHTDDLPDGLLDRISKMKGMSQNETMPATNRPDLVEEEQPMSPGLTGMLQQLEDEDDLSWLTDAQQGGYDPAAEQEEQLPSEANKEVDSDWLEELEGIESSPDAQRVPTGLTGMFDDEDHEDTLDNLLDEMDELPPNIDPDNPNAWMQASGIEFDEDATRQDLFPDFDEEETSFESADVSPVAWLGASSDEEVDENDLDPLAWMEEMDDGEEADASAGDVPNFFDDMEDDDAPAADVPNFFDDLDIDEDESADDNQWLGDEDMLDEMLSLEDENIDIIAPTDALAFEELAVNADDEDEELFPSTAELTAEELAENAANFFGDDDDIDLDDDWSPEDAFEELGDFDPNATPDTDRISSGRDLDDDVMLEELMEFDPSEKPDTDNIFPSDDRSDLFDDDTADDDDSEAVQDDWAGDEDMLDEMLSFDDDFDFDAEAGFDVDEDDSEAPQSEDWQETMNDDFNNDWQPEQPDDEQDPLAWLNADDSDAEASSAPQFFDNSDNEEVDLEDMFAEMSDEDIDDEDSAIEWLETDEMEELDAATMPGTDDADPLAWLSDEGVEINDEGEQSSTGMTDMLAALENEDDDFSFKEDSSSVEENFIDDDVEVEETGSWLDRVDLTNVQPASDESSANAEPEADWLAEIEDSGEFAEGDATNEIDWLADDDGDDFTFEADESEASDMFDFEADDESEASDMFDFEEDQATSENLFDFEEDEDDAFDFDTTPATPNESEPDWLSALGSVDEFPEADDEEDFADEDADDESDWMSEADDVVDEFEEDEEEFELADEQPDWLSEVSVEGQSEADEDLAAEDTNDWLSELGEFEDESDDDEEFALDFSDDDDFAEEEATTDDAPDWLSGVAAAGAGAAAAMAANEFMNDDDDDESDNLFGDFDDEEFGEEAVAGDEPDWLSGAGAFEEGDAETVAQSDDDDEDGSDWLTDIGDFEADDDDEAVAEEGFTLDFEDDDDEAVAEEESDWMAEDDLFESDEFEDDDEAVAEDAPDWLSAAGGFEDDDEEAVAEEESDWMAEDDLFESDEFEEEADAVEESDWLSEAGGFEDEDEDAVAEEESDWMAEDDLFESDDFEEAEAVAEDEPDWLSAAGGFEDDEAVAEDEPDWLSSAGDFEEDDGEEVPEKTITQELDWIEEDEEDYSADTSVGATATADYLEEVDPATAESALDWMTDADAEDEIIFDEPIADQPQGITDFLKGDSDDDMDEDEDDGFGWEEGVAAAGAGAAAALAANELFGDDEDEDFDSGDEPDWLSAADEFEADEDDAFADEDPDWLTITDEDGASAVPNDGFDYEDDDTVIGRPDLDFDIDEDPDWLEGMGEGDGIQDAFAEHDSDFTDEFAQEFAENSGEDDNIDAINEYETEIEPDVTFEEDDLPEFTAEELFSGETQPSSGLSEDDYLDDFEEETDFAPAEAAPDWLNAMVPGLDIDYAADEDEPVDQGFIGESQSSSSKEGFGWLTDIVDEETGAMPPVVPKPQPVTAPRFSFSKPPAWLSKLLGGGAASASVADVADDFDDDLASFDDIDDFDDSDDLPDWLEVDDE